MESCNVQIVGTGSDGNCYLLTFKGKTLVIEAGVVFSAVKKALDFDFSNVVGVLVSHEHGDHSKCVKDFIKFGKKILCTLGTAMALRMDKGFKAIRCLEATQIDIFRVTPFKVFHDAKEPCGFLIEFEGRRLAFITDTNDLRIRLKNIDYWLIECNYSSEMLRNSSLDVRLKKRIQDSHMSVDRCRTILEAHDAQNSDLVLLIHSSHNHSNKEEFLTKIPYASIAEDGLIIEL